jgi:hypothetical protein
LLQFHLGISETIPLSSWPKPDHIFSFVADILSIIPLKLEQLKLAVSCSSTDFDHLIFIGFGHRANSSYSGVTINDSW